MKKSTFLEVISASWRGDANIQVINDSVQKSRVVIHKVENVYYVAFRSTANSENVEDDLNIIPDKNSTKGFNEVYSSLKLKLFSKLSELGVNEISIVGHSLGAACGTIFSEDWLKSGKAIKEMVLIATPNCMAASSIKYILSKVKVRSYLNGKDPIQFAIPFYSGFPRIPINTSNKYNWWKLIEPLDHKVSSTPNKAIGYKDALPDSV